MATTLELPNGDEVTPDDVFLYNDYPYRVRWLDSDTHAFELAPLYWGDSGMDVPFRDREALVDQWDADSRGLLSPEEWDQWLARARTDDRFGDSEVDELAAALPAAEAPTDQDSGSDGPFERVRSLFGR